LHQVNWFVTKLWFTNQEMTTCHWLVHVTWLCCLLRHSAT